MKIFNIQRDLLKGLINKERIVRYEIDEDYVLLCTSYLGFKMRKKDLFLDLEKIEKLDFDSILKCEGEDVELQPTDDIKLVGKKNYQKIANDNLELYVDYKALKYFDKPTLKGLGKNKTVFVYEGYDLVGIIMPLYSK